MRMAAWAARPIRRADWSWISDWFTDPTLDRELGPMDDAWLDHVLNETDGVELVITMTGRPVALAGFRWDPVTGINYLTDFAVDPCRRRQGVGATALATALSWTGHPRAREWTASVSPSNTAARRFFVAQGWHEVGPDGEMIRMSTPWVSPA